MFSKISFVLVLLGLVNSSFQQAWKNDKIVWDSNFFNQGQAQPQKFVPQQQQQQQPQAFQQQWQQQQFVQKAPVQQPVQPMRPMMNQAPVQAPAPVRPQVQPAVAAVPNGPYPIQQPTITNTGETIVENLIGGITFNCQGKPTGHHRDNNFCDVFHACVFGQQRKTYSCPFVGEHTYFDDVTRRCEFARNNPSACASNAYLSF